MSTTRWRSIGVWTEAAFCVGIVLLIVYSLWYLHHWGYLPQPFFNDTNDTYMDWFNVSWWGRDPGTYDNYRTIYPPLSFLLGKLASISRCYESTPSLARDCDWLGRSTIFAFFVLNIVLIRLTYLKVDRRTAVMRSIGAALGFPMLYALDRGQMLLPCFTCFLLANGPLLRSARLKWLFFGLAINFKVYLLPALFGQLLRRRWLVFEGGLIAAVAVYVLSYGILGRGSPLELYDNLVVFSSSGISVSFMDLWNSLTYTPHLSLLNGPFPIGRLLGSDVVDALTIAIPLTLGLVQASIIAACAATWLRPEAVPLHRLTYFGLAFSMLTFEPGGYAQCLLTFLVFFERWRGIGRPVAIICCYLAALPGDIVLVPIGGPPVQLSYHSDLRVIVDYGIAIGPLVRPGLALLAAFALSLVTMRDVWTDIRNQRWRERRRFDHDLPLLTAGGASARIV